MKIMRRKMSKIIKSLLSKTFLTQIMLSKIITTAAIMTTVASAAIVQTKYPSTDCTGDPATVTYEVSAIKFNAHNP